MGGQSMVDHLQEHWEALASNSSTMKEGCKERKRDAGYLIKRGHILTNNGQIIVTIIRQERKEMTHLQLVIISFLK